MHNTSKISATKTTGSLLSISSKCNLSHCFGLTRYLILILNTICLSLIASNWLALNFTVICMVRKQNATTVAPIFTPTQQGWLFSGAMVGRVLGTPPISFVIARIGFRYTFLVYCMISTLATLFTPIGVHFGGFLPLLFIQFLQGVAVSVGWSAAGVVSSGWSPPDSYGLFLSVLTLNFQFGPVIVMPLAAAICSSEQLGWPVLYYLLGTATAIFSAIFFAFYRDTPREQRNVCKSELALIERHPIGAKDKQIRQKVPYKAIFSDPIIWAQLCAHITRNLGYMIPLVYSAIYFNKVLGVQLANTGITAAFPFVVCIVVKVLGGPLSDWQKLSEKGRVVFFASTQYLAALCYLLVAILPKFGIQNLTLVELCFAGITASLVLSLIGAAKCTQLVAKQFAHVIFAWQYFMTSLIFLTIPVIISWVAPDNTAEEWSLIFLCSAVSLTTGVTVFNLTIRLEPRPWVMAKNGPKDEEEEDDDENDECELEEKSQIL